MKIYMPVNSVNDFSCYVIYDSETIRAFVDNPHIGQNAYTDFYINSHYLSKEGVQEITSSLEFPQCENIHRITNDYYYRNDFAHIVVIVMFVVFFILLTIKVFSRMFGRWLKI